MALIGPEDNILVVYHYDKRGDFARLASTQVGDTEETADKTVEDRARRGFKETTGIRTTLLDEAAWAERQTLKYYDTAIFVVHAWKGPWDEAMSLLKNNFWAWVQKERRKIYKWGEQV